MKRKILSILVALCLLFACMFQVASAAPSLDTKGHASHYNLKDLNKWKNMITGLSLDSTVYSLEIKEKHDMTVQATFSNNITADVTEYAQYTSSNTAVATVNQNGKVKGVSAGTAVISVSFFGKTATATVTVSSLWTLVWSDEFDDTAIDPAKWTYDIGNGGSNPGWGNNEKEYYTSDAKNLNEENGVLNISAIKEAAKVGGMDYTSARVKTQGLFSKKYGKFEIRAKVPGGPGLWPAIWLLPEYNAYGGWAASGEIDIFEGKGSDTSSMSGTIHYGSNWPNNKYTGKPYAFPDGGTTTEFHTYALEWEPGEMRWYVDGTLFQTQNDWYSRGLNTAANYTYPAPFDQPFHLIMNLAVGGNFDGDPTADTQFPASMQVDYVRVYELTGRDYRTPVEPVADKEPVPAEARPAVDGSFIYNGGFNQDDPAVIGVDGVANTDYWQFLHLADFGGNGNLSVDTIDGTNYAKIDITNGGAQTYSVQLIQDNMPMVKGHFYKVGFDAKSSAARTVATKISAPNRGFATYSDSEVFNLTDTFKHYEYLFQMTQTTDLTGRFELNAGLNTNPVWIGNIKLEEIDGIAVDENAAKPPLDGGNHVYNGTFDQGGMDRMIFWNFGTSGASAAASVDEASRELKVGITDGGTGPGAIQLIQKGMNLIQGQDYQVTFRARADAPRTIQVDLLGKDGTASYSGPKSINLTAVMEEKTFTFTMPGATDAEGQLVLSFGGAGTDVYIDDVSMIRTSAYIDPSVVLFPLKNGDFDSVLDPWKVNNADGAGAVVSVEGGQLKAAITNTGANPWSIMPFQEGLSLSGGVEYLLEFDASSSAARDIQLSVENSAYFRYVNNTVSLTPEMKRYSYTFKMPKDDICGLKFLIGNVPGAGSIGAHDILIDNVVFEVKAAKQYSSILKNGTFKDGTNNWTVFAADWEGANAIPTVSNDGLKLSIGYEGQENWAVQLIQGNFAIQSGNSYVLTFDANSSIARNIEAIVENSTNYTKYLDSVIALSGEKKTFSLKFMGTDDPATHLVFALGKIGSADPLGPHDVTISNVSLMENPYGFTPPPPVEGHALLNGTFDTNMDNWGTYLGDGSNAVFSVDTGKLNVTFPNYDGWFPWSTQVYQDNLLLEAGKSYTLTFDTSATEAKDILVSIEKAADYNVKYLATQTVSATVGISTASFSFTMGADTEQNAKLIFQLGSSNATGPHFAGQSVYLDNISLVETT